jgi:7-cyano-7-deazaguanine synthase
VDRVAVLASGGLDSCVLLADLAASREVYPLYVAAGLAWEAEERRALEAFLAAVDGDVRPLTVLTLAAKPLLDGHWSLTGVAVPGADTPDSAVLIPGRNVILFALASVWCATHGVGEIAIGSLGDNPFSDATPAFFADFGRALSAGLGHNVRLVAPYRGRHKHELVAAHRDLPLELTLTCMAPSQGRHCGRCNKCYERQVAFARAGVDDRTLYLEPGGGPPPERA